MPLAERLMEAEQAYCHDLELDRLFDPGDEEPDAAVR